MIDIVLACRILDGQVWARAAQLKPKSYFIVTPRAIDRCRGRRARRLFVVGHVPLTQEKLKVLEACFYSWANYRRFKVVPVGDRA